MFLELSDRPFRSLSQEKKESPENQSFGLFSSMIDPSQDDDKDSLDDNEPQTMTSGVFWLIVR